MRGMKCMGCVLKGVGGSRERVSRVSSCVGLPQRCSTLLWGEASVRPSCLMPHAEPPLPPARHTLPLPDPLFSLRTFLPSLPHPVVFVFVFLGLPTLQPLVVSSWRPQHAYRSTRAHTPPPSILTLLGFAFSPPAELSLQCIAPVVDVRAMMECPPNANY